MNTKYFFTTGNKKGVGLEIAIKAFLNSKHTEAKIIMCDRDELIKYTELFKINIDKLNLVHDLADDIDNGVYFYTKGKPVEWFFHAVEYCENNPKTSALVTGPLSKDQFKDPNVKGHTSFFENKYSKLDLFMTFLGEVYGCLLLTDHVPLLKLDTKEINKRLPLAINLLKKVCDDFKLTKPIGVLGLNPHAGESGLIGSEESLIHQKVLSDFDNVQGPLPADGFFSKEDYEKYSFLIANYHDQGLIPFKLLNGFKACQTTLGLPFVRTSVNHGTAENLYLKNMANEESLIYAFETAKKLLKRRRGV